MNAETTSLDELLIEQKKLNQRIENAIVAKREEGAAKLLEVVKTYGLEPDFVLSILGIKASGKKTTQKVKPKYALGDKQWTGRGKLHDYLHQQAMQGISKEEALQGILINERYEP